MSEREQQYWALVCNPDYYRIYDAMKEVKFDNWQTNSYSPRAGDRALIWKAIGNRDRTSKRGFIAIAEIISDPAEMLDLHPEYQTFTSPEPPEPTRMVMIHYKGLLDKPLWLDDQRSDDETSLLRSLLLVQTNARGSCFPIQRAQWDKLMTIVHPRMDATPQERISPIDTQVRRAIELRAVQVSTEYYRASGWHVEDTSMQQSYDLRCTYPNKPELHVEVKGTTGTGEQVILTTNEVEHARRQHPNVALAIVSHIQVTIDEKRVPWASGGELRVLEPWTIDEGKLTVTQYTYDVPS